MYNCLSSIARLWSKGSLDCAASVNKERSFSEPEVSSTQITQSTQAYSLLSTCVLGLAEGYLAADDLNSEKFIPNFFLKNPNVWQENEKRDLGSAGQEEPWRSFWKGPRDRLYRYIGIRKPRPGTQETDCLTDLAISDAIRVETSNGLGKNTYSWLCKDANPPNEVGPTTNVRYVDSG